MSLAINTGNDTSPFDSIRRTDEQGEYWLARDLMKVMGYGLWQNFEKSIEEAIENLELNQDKTSDHFLLVSIKSKGRNAKDYRLSRYGCYMTAICCDARKTEVSLAKKYFVVKAREAETVIPQQSDRLRELEMQLELARTQERLSNSQHKLLATVHLLETVAPGLAPLALGRPDAVITRNEYIERTITNNGTFEGVGITYIQKRFGFKSTKAAWDWLDSIGYGKDSGFWESQPALVHTPRLTPNHLEVVKTKFASKEGNRQMIFGE